MASGRETAYEDWSAIIERNAADLSDKTYIEAVDEGRRITFGELDAWCNRIGRFLAERRIGTGDRVSLIGPNTIETLILYFSVLKHGAVLSPIFAEESAENLRRIIGMVKPKIVFHEAGLAIGAGGGGPEWISFSASGRAEGKEGDVFTRSRGYEPGFQGRRAGPADTCLILYTSGTTETPKGIRISREGLFYMVDEVSERTGMTGEDRVLEYRAYNWASVQLLTVLSCMLKGATLFLAKRFSRRRFPSWLADNGITISSGVPAVINMLIGEPVGMKREDVPSLKYITSSSAPLSVESHLRFEKIYGIPIQQMMGMSEAGWMAGNPPGRRKVGSVGLPMKHKTVRFLNERGGACKAGEVGEMVVAGKSMGLCYSKEDGTADPFPADGFATGDLGYMDEEGYIFITGRKKELIIRGGINISPMEITSRLMEHASVVEAATLGVPDSIYGEEVVSFVVARPGSSAGEEELIAHCKKTLPDFKVPKRVIFVEALPKNQRGKVASADLLALFLRGSKPEE